ncbi:DUF3822 family protein [Bacteroidales bacterium OttesenSCG-928-K03]|nr:DUF3822 family protein [Odoribacter sp. OttesenSCG-928-L07]MDL2243169.1 DUF3822 family protein [Bacteroidales bacterium OttesenSCG-928-K03]
METGNNFFDPTYIHKYNLSVFLSKDGFSFIVSDENYNCLLKKNIQIKDKEEISLTDQYLLILENNNILKENFRKKKIIFCADKFTFIPKDFFDPGYITDYYNFNLGELNDNQMPYYVRSSSNMFVVFSFNKDLVKLLEENFEGAEFTTSISNFIDSVSTEAVILGKSVFAHKRNDILEIVIYKNNKIFAANSFKVQSDKDIVYFILSAFNNYDLDGNFVPISISGDINPKSKDLDLLSKYITNIVISDEDNKWYL